MAYQVIIIEDDPMVAAIDRQYVETDSRFQVTHVLKSGGEALGVLENCRPDLIILDFYTPSMDGMEFVDRLHAMGQYPAIIMVTSANDREIVHGLLSRGCWTIWSSPSPSPGSGRPWTNFFRHRICSPVLRRAACWTSRPSTA